MTFHELQEQVGEFVYTEDNGMARIALASVIANRMKLGDPVWMLLIGPSSGGKSQILRPIALSDEKFIHRVDDMTENTLLSGTKVKEGEKSVSLLKRIGAQGIIVISDFTVIFSKGSESRAAILSQLRMVYDGEMTKFSGNSNTAITWKGYLGVLAGSTPSVYAHFEEVSDMGERFIYYRMKPYDVTKATRISLERNLFGKDLDQKLADMYGGYIKSSIQSMDEVPMLSRDTEDRILTIALFAAQLRTPIHFDRFSKQVDRVPVPEAPMRVALQLRAIARGLSVMSHADTGEWELSEEDHSYIEWCAYSLANEERRACLRVLATIDYGVFVKTQTVADEIGLSTAMTGLYLQNLASVGIVERNGNSDSLAWAITNIDTWGLVRRLEGIDGTRQLHFERSRSAEEGFDKEQVDADFENWPTNVELS